MLFGKMMFLKILKWPKGYSRHMIFQKRTQPLSRHFRNWRRLKNKKELLVPLVWTTTMTLMTTSMTTKLRRGIHLQRRALALTFLIQWTKSTNRKGSKSQPSLGLVMELHSLLVMVRLTTSLGVSTRVSWVCGTSSEEISTQSNRTRLSRFRIA